MSSKKGYVDTSIPLINALLKFKIFIILTNWTFQGMLYADKTERSFRLLLDAIMIIILYSLFVNIIEETYINLIFSFILSHTINWVFNGQLFVLGRYIGIKPNKQDEFYEYSTKIKNRVQREKSIDCVLVYGSLVRREIKSTSDLDMRIIRKSGFVNGIRACFFGMMERSRALFNKFPLDLYVIDSTKHLMKMRFDEMPEVIYDSNNITKNK